MNAVLWFAFICFGISGICFVADAFLKLGRGAGTSNGPGVHGNAETPFPPASDGGAGTSNGPSRLGSGGSPSSVDFREALKPIGPAPSWAEVRRGE